MTGQAERNTQKKKRSSSKTRRWNSPNEKSNVGTPEAEPSWTSWKTQALEAEPSWTPRQTIERRNARGRAFVDILENPGLRGSAFVAPGHALATRWKTGQHGAKLRANMSQFGPTWGHLGANIRPTRANLDKLGPTGANLVPTWGQLGVILAQHGPT